MNAYGRSPWHVSWWLFAWAAGALAIAGFNTAVAARLPATSRELWVTHLAAPLSSPAHLRQAIAMLAGPFVRPPKRGSEDLTDSLRAVEKLRAAGRTPPRLYDASALLKPPWVEALRRLPAEPPRHEYFLGTFVYSPAVCVLLWPFGVLSLATATQCLEMLFRLCWLASVVLSVRLARSAETSLGEARIEPDPWHATALTAVMLALYIPGVRMLYLVQIQSLLTLLIVAAIVAWHDEHEEIAGVALAVAAAVKPNWAVLLAFGLLRRRWRFVAAMALTLGVVVTAGGLLAGWDNWRAYLTEVMPRLGACAVPFAPNQSFSGLFYRWIAHGPAWLYAPLEPVPAITRASRWLGGLVLVVALWPRRASLGRFANSFDFAIALLAAQLASPISWEHHYAWTIAVFALVFAYYRRGGAPGTAGKWLLFCLAYLLAANFIYASFVSAGGWRSLYYSHLLAGMCVLFVLLHAARRDARAELRANGGG
jgi:hypothetical protein